MAQQLTTTQEAALEQAGREIAKGWIDNGSGPEDMPSRDYDFSAQGDWEYVQDVAIKAGVDWDRRSAQPASELIKPVWTAVERGYRAAIDEHEAA